MVADIIDVIRADHLHIMHWAARLGELSRRDRGPEDGLELVMTWATVATLIDLHMRAEDEICGPAVFGATPQGRALARQTRAAHEDIREMLREIRLLPPGSPRWWQLAGTALSAWAVQRDQEEHGPLAACRRRASLALRERLAREWRAFIDARIRDQYPQAPPDMPTHQLRQDDHAPVTVPRLADPIFGPLACTCRACTRTLDWVIFQQRKQWRERSASLLGEARLGKCFALRLFQSPSAVIVECVAGRCGSAPSPVPPGKSILRRAAGSNGAALRLPEGAAEPCPTRKPAARR